MPKTKYYLTCECNSQSFDEITTEISRQSGVRITKEGPDYDNAGEITVEGETVNILYYECTECRKTYTLEDIERLKSD